MDRLKAFLGLPYPLAPGINLYSPTINEIGVIGHVDYMINVQLSLFNKKKILLDLFGIDEEVYNKIENEDDYSVLIDHPDIRNYIAKALSFFVKDDVVFKTESQSFYVAEKEFINKTNFQSVASIIRKLNAVPDDIGPGELRSNKPNSKTAKLLEEMKSFEKKISSGDDEMELKDICSILCIAPDNGINIHNIGDLTIFQVYEQFERMASKDEFNRALPIWANGHWDSKEKFPEWIKRTKT